jgi:hypothetical protein
MTHLKLRCACLIGPYVTTAGFATLVIVDGSISCIVNDGVDRCLIIMYVLAATNTIRLASGGGDRFFLYRCVVCGCIPHFAGPVMCSAFFLEPKRPVFVFIASPTAGSARLSSRRVLRVSPVAATF